MTEPAIAFRRFLIGLFLGCTLGIVYGFLRPIRRGKAILADIIFMVFAGWVYLYYGFSVCKGDLRLGYTLPPILSAMAWNSLFTLWLQPIFDGFWLFVAKIFAPFQIFFKKSMFFIKFLFASGKKWVKIKSEEHTQRKPPRKGVGYGSKKQSLQSH